MTNSIIRRIISILFYLYLSCVLFVHVMHADDFKELNNYFLGIRNDHWLHGILFIPLGFLVKFHFEKWKIAIIFTLFCCFFFEILQYFLPYRSFEFSDIISDTCGATFGMFLYLVSHKWIIRVLDRNLSH